MADVRGKGLARLYHTGGTTFLAARLTRLFVRIEKGDDEARVLHNDVFDDVMELINTQPEGELLTKAESGFLESIANYLLYRQDNERDFEEVFIERKKRFLFRMAERIMHLASMKGQ